MIHGFSEGFQWCAVGLMNYFFGMVAGQLHSIFSLYMIYICYLQKSAGERTA